MAPDQQDRKKQGSVPEKNGQEGNSGHRGPGTLSLVSTPIGNLEDITLRALRCLKEADLILAEDTRHSRKLLSRYDIHCPLVSYYQEVEKRKSGEILNLLMTGKNIALVTDAGTPAISDPGAYLVGEAKKNNIPIQILPGPSAVTTALVGAGLALEQFTFFGFLDAKSSQRRIQLESIKNRPETLVFFLSPHKLVATLKDMLDILGDREAVMCREMTKIHEEFVTATLSVLLERAETVNRGEYTLVLSGSHDQVPVSGESIQAELARLQSEGLKLNQAIARVARRKGLPRSEVYTLAHALSKKSN